MSRDKGDKFEQKTQNNLKKRLKLTWLINMFQMNKNEDYSCG